MGAVGARTYVAVIAALAATSAHYAQFVEVRPDGCWAWAGGRDSDGYGLYRPPGSRRKYRAHRWAWAAANPGAALPPMVCHTCDRPWCVNPGHLFAGDAQANHDDMVGKGRRVNPSQRLTDSMVIEIRRRYDDGEDAARIAGDYGITRAHVYGIGKRQSRGSVAGGGGA